MLHKLRVCNLCIILLNLVFQIPIFECPALEIEKSLQDNFITNKRCQILQESPINPQDLAFQSPSFAFYVILMRSLGLSKLYRDLQLPLILLVLATELQTYLFLHPYFRTYILGHQHQERALTGKLRAFLYVQRTHLQRLWAYKSIKEEIKILHSRLMRITRGIKGSEHSRHLIRDDEGDSLSQNDEGGEEEESLMREQSSSDAMESRHQKASRAEQVVREQSTKIESMVIEMLAKEGSPVVSLQMVMEAFTMEVKTRLAAGREVQMDQEEVDGWLEEVAGKLQNQVELKSRIDLYYKAGLGLHFAVT
jgi:hypothetical protein